MTANIQEMEFQAETKQLLELMIHSLYTHKEIFLRELISNASDALDRLRFESITNPELLGDDSNFEIRLDADEQKRTLTVIDNGIGMSRDEVIANIGTIAKSGTREMREKIKQGQSPEMLAEFIGQFGVGFYSAFMVADKVELVTRRAGETAATRWESTGDGRYTVGEGERVAAYLKLQEVNRQKTVFLASAAHELKTPLAVIKGYYDLLLTGSLGRLTEKQKDILEESKESCERLVRLVSMFLNYSALESGKLVLQLRENDLRDCLDEVARLRVEGFQRKGVKLETQLDPSIPTFRFDYQKVQQVAANLLDNALKHTTAGGMRDVARQAPLLGAPHCRGGACSGAAKIPAPAPE